MAAMIWWVGVRDMSCLSCFKLGKVYLDNLYVGVVFDEGCGREQTPVVLERERPRGDLGGLTCIRLWSVSIFLGA